MSPESEKEILSRLLLDEKDTLNKLDEIVSIAEKLFKIDLSSSSIVLSEYTRLKLKEKEKITVYLIAKYFGAKKLKHNDSPLMQDEWASGSEIADALGKKLTDISGRLTELVRDGMIEKDGRGRYRIRYHRIDTILHSLDSKSPGG